MLNRGRSLSIDSNINHQGANAALLNVSTRIAALYMLLGNEAYMDQGCSIQNNSRVTQDAVQVHTVLEQFHLDV